MTEASFPFSSVGIIGLGLMGGSLGLALRREKVPVIGFDHDPAVRQEAAAIGLVDEVTSDLAQTAAGRDLVVLAVPVGDLPTLLRDLANLSTPPGLVTDLGSTKGEILETYRNLPSPSFPFVGSHPIAGTERSGPKAAQADLYEGAVVVLCSPAAGKPLQNLGLFWEKLGCRVEILEPDLHDRLMAWVSHLPHMAAYALVYSLLKAESPEILETFVAGGFRDFTRIAASSPIMWRDISLSNADALLAALDTFIANLKTLRTLLERKDGPGIENFFSRARELRIRLTSTSQKKT